MDALLTAALQQRLGGAEWSETLARLAEDDPQMAQFAQLLALREQQEAENNSEDSSISTAELVRSREEERREEITALKHYAEEVADEAKRVQNAYEREFNKRKRLEDVIERVARALGACPACLGMEESEPCDLCQNRVGPGSMPPAPEEFQTIVLPAVQAHIFHTRSQNLRDRRSTQGVSHDRLPGRN